MFINHIDLLNFRSYEELHLELENRINCFVGPNACGKTNLIEAIYYLALTRSFRKANDDALIRFNSDSASVLIDYFDDKSEKHEISAFITKRGKLICLDSEKQKSAAGIIGKLPCVCYSPTSVNMFKNEPQERRNFLDSSISFISSNYIYALSRFKKVLKERNNALAQGYDEELIEVLTNELINVSYRIYVSRDKFVKDLNSQVNQIYSNWFERDKKMEVVYKTNVPKFLFQSEFVSSYKNAFNRIKSEERLRKTTLIGVQKDDFIGKIDGKEISLYASQGQHRLASLTVYLAFKKNLEEIKKEKAILLLDDVLSELDMRRQINLLNNLDKDGGQVLITSANKIDFKNMNTIEVEKLYGR